MLNKIIHYSFVLFCFIVGVTGIAVAQDPQLSQYYNAPLYINPAFAGTGDNTRAIFNYRNQWPGISPPYTTFAFSLDHDLRNYKSGIGLLILKDKQGEAGLTSTEISPIFSYQLDLNSQWTFRPGIQATFVTRGADYSSFLFGDQLANGNATQDQLVYSDRKNNYVDVSSGGLLYSDKFWVGVSLHHLNKPNQSYSTDKFPLPIKTSIHTGYKISLENKYYSQEAKEKSLTPTLLYKRQGKFEQLDLGLYLTYQPLMLGMWYRGIPVKTTGEISHHESLVFLTGVNYKGLTFSYSYDLTISKLSPASGGAHEIALIYEWEIPYKTKKKIMKRIPCPKFSRWYN